MLILTFKYNSITIPINTLLYIIVFRSQHPVNPLIALLRRKRPFKLELTLLSSSVCTANTAQTMDHMTWDNKRQRSKDTCLCSLHSTRSLFGNLTLEVDGQMGNFYFIVHFRCGFALGKQTNNIPIKFKLQARTVGAPSSPSLSVSFKG